MWSLFWSSDSLPRPCCCCRFIHTQHDDRSRGLFHSVFTEELFQDISSQPLRNILDVIHFEIDHLQPEQNVGNSESLVGDSHRVGPRSWKSFHLEELTFPPSKYFPDPGRTNVRITIVPSHPTETETEILYLPDVSDGSIRGKKNTSCHVTRTILQSLPKCYSPLEVYIYTFQG